MTTTPDGSLWVGSKQNGLTRIKDGVSTFYSAARDSMRTLIDDHINALCSDKTGNLWIATNGGLQVFNPKMNTFSSYTKENGILSTNNITSLFYGVNNNLLIGTAEGLIILNLSTREKTVLTGNTSNMKSFTNNFITQVYEDSRGLLWVGTREGVNILNPANDELNILTEKDGLCNNSICGIAEDNNHSIFDHHIMRHALNTSGIVRFPERQYDMVRIGIGLYGIRTLFDGSEDALMPVSALRSIIISIKQWPAGTTVGYGRRGLLERDSRIATVNIGYADGFDRHFGGGKVNMWVGGKLCPTVGNVCMDAVMIDVTDAPCKVGDTVEIFGEHVPVEQLSEARGTIPYEILTSISPRVKRVYYRE